MRYRWLLLAASLLAACAGQPLPPAPTPASRLCVVRHAQAFKNLDPPPPGLGPEQLDTLTPEGERQARALRAALPPGVARLWASPTGRTRQTAALLGLSLPAQVIPALRPLAGRLAWEARLAAWAAGHDPRPADGESLADGDARIAALLQRLRAALGPGEHAVVVTHGDIASLLIGALRGTPLLERPRRDPLETGAVLCQPLHPAPLP